MNKDSMKKGLHNDMPNDPMKDIRKLCPRLMTIAVEDWEQLRQENATLRQQIEDMKCCSNCKNIKISGSCIVGINYYCIKENYRDWQMKGAES